MYLQLFPFTRDILKLDESLRYYWPRFEYHDTPLESARAYTQLYAIHFDPTDVNCDRVALALVIDFQGSTPEYILSIRPLNEHVRTIMIVHPDK